MAVAGLVGSRRPFEAIEESVSTVRSSKDPRQILEALVNLGIHPEDAQAHETMMKKIIEVIDPSVHFIPSPGDPGIYFVYNLKDYSEREQEAVLEEIHAGLSRHKPSESVEPTAVFKIGAQRAKMELIARKVAYLTGFAPYAISGSFYALKNPNLSCWAGEHSFEEVLWNGKCKELCSKQLNPEARVVGILEPFVKTESHSKQKKKELFAHIVTFALVVGWRDGKERNKEDVLTDLEECMPRMLTPANDVSLPVTSEDFLQSASSTHVVAATHLPFLEEDTLTEEPFNKKDLLRLISIVSSWNIEEILDVMKNETIQFADFTSETEESIEDEEVLDDNHCLVRILNDVILHEDGLYDPKFLSGQTPALDQNQLDAFRMRLTKIKEAILSKREKTMTPADLVEHVDPFYWRHVQLVKAGKKIAERRTLSSTSEIEKSPGISVRASQESPIQRFLSRSISHPGRGPAPASILSPSLRTPGAIDKLMEEVVMQ